MSLRNPFIGAQSLDCRHYSLTRDVPLRLVLDRSPYRHQLRPLSRHPFLLRPYMYPDYLLSIEFIR